MTPENLPILIVIGIAAVLIGLSKGGLGGAIVVIITPTLALVLPPSQTKDAVGLSLPLLLLGDVFAVTMFWRKWDGRLIWRLLPGLIAGIIVGSILLPYLSPQAVRISIAVMVMIFCAYKLFEARLKRLMEKRGQASGKASWWNGALFAGTSGVASTVANAGGPIISVYFLMERLTPIPFIGTSALYFALANTLKIPGLINAGVLRADMIWRVAWAAPLVPLGVWLGKVAVKYISPQTFEKIILSLLFITAIVLILL